VYVNADEIAAHAGCSDLDAAREAEMLREALVGKGLDLTFETVLSTPRNLDLIRRAKAVGYHIASVFVLTVSAEINVLRVANRRALGGHDVPGEKVRSRYAKSLANLPSLARISDTVTVLDNSLEAPAVIYRQDAERQVVSPSSVWSDGDIRRLLGLDTAGEPE
jgi:predicted ABC-type ATPase